MSSRIRPDGRRGNGTVDCAAREPHCGVCRHVTFRGDWDRTPRCSRWGERTAIAVGETCREFEPSPAVASTSE